MDKYILALVILLIILIFKICRNQITVPVEADHRKWNVIGDYENKKEAAELLSRVNSSMIEFMRYLREKYHIDETDDVIQLEDDKHTAIMAKPGDVYNIVDKLLDNYNPEVFYENDPRYSNGTSYTINKGDAMYICLREKGNPSQLMDFQTMLFVLLHEASHIANYRGWGHGEDFWIIYKFILKEAHLSGIYKPVDYSKYPKDYCGLLITYNPFFDNDLIDLDN